MCNRVTAADNSTLIDKEITCEIRKISAKLADVKIRNIPAGIWCHNDVILTSMRRDDVASTLIRRHFHTKCPLGYGLRGAGRVLYLHENVSMMSAIKENRISLPHIYDQEHTIRI